MFNTRDSIKTFADKKTNNKFDWRTNLESLVNRKKASKDKQPTTVYFNRKKILIVIGWGFLFCLLIFISINFFLDINISQLAQLIVKNAVKPRFLFTVIFSSSIFLFSDVWLQILGLKLRVGKQLHHLPYKEWVTFIMISFFVQTITPFAIGSEAYAIWWFKKNHVDIKEASAIVSVSTFCWFASQFLITWPSFILITANNFDDIVALNVGITYWLILVGLLVDAMIWLVIVVISYSTYAHYYIAIITNKVKKFFMLEYSSISDLNYKYLIDNTFQKIYIKKLTSKITLLSIFLFLLNNFMVYTLYACIMTVFNEGQDFWDAYHTINVSTTANNFLPIPSAEGSLQLTIKKLSVMMDKNKAPVVATAATTAQAAASNTLDYSIFVWRFFCKYLGLFISFIWIVYKAMFDKTSDKKTSSFMLDTI